MPGYSEEEELIRTILFYVRQLVSQRAGSGEKPSLRNSTGISSLTKDNLQSTFSTDSEIV